MYNNPFYREQPIQNIFTNQMPNNNFMARFLKEGELPEETIISSKTALISLSMKKLFIKEIDGSMASYDIVLPLDEKDKKIQELESQINELKEMMINEQSNVTNNATNNEIRKSDGDVKKPNRK